MTSSRDDILTAIRRHEFPAVPRPDLDHDWIEYGQPAQQFAEMLAAVGGRAVNVRDVAELNELLSSIPEYTEAKSVCSLVDGVGRSTVVLDSIDDPHDLADVDFAIMSAEFAVAENGAVWITDRDVKHRVLKFISQHLMFVVPASEIVSNMHQAYQRLEFGDRLFGAFVSGPSKTADIEQSLVIGAHGARSLVVALVGE